MSQTRSSQRNASLALLAIFTLARWRLRQSWFLLLITALGMIAAVVMICLVPLFSAVMTTAGLRNTFNATPTSDEILAGVNTFGLSSSIEQTAHAQFEQLIHQNLGSLVQPIQSEIFVPNFSLVTPPHPHSSLLTTSVDMQQAAAHLGQLQGRVPQVTAQPASNVEVLLTATTAHQFGLSLGSTFPLQFSYTTKVGRFGDTQQAVQSVATLTAHVVGIFTLNGTDQAYWHGQDFSPLMIPTEAFPVYSYAMLMSNNTLLALANTLASNAHTDAVYTTLDDGYNFEWYYRFDVAHIYNNDLNPLINQLVNLQSIVLNLYTNGSAQHFPYITRASLQGDVFGTASNQSNLEDFQGRVAVAHIPVVILALQILALILFFVNLLANLLVERQADVLALLRSRGASSLQIFCALLVQSVLLAIVAVMVGVPLSLVAALALAQRVLPTAELNALNVITHAPVQAVQQIIGYAVAIALVAILTMCFPLLAAARSDVLATRRERTRAGKRPLWQRFNLDVIAGVVALVGYGISLYLSSVGNVLQGDAQTLVVTPLSILAPFFLIIGCMLLFLRLFPLLLRVGAWLAARSRGAASLLAMTYIARSPYQSIRMTMMLALAVAFSLFTLVFSATEATHIQEISTYLTGADFSGALSTQQSQLTQAQALQQYQAIPGVLSATVGYTASGQAGATNLPIAIRAVDTTTFANATIWASSQDYRTAQSLLAQLNAERSQALSTNLLPVIVDENVLSSLRLHVGSQFVVNQDNVAAHDLHCVIVGVIAHLPTVNDRLATASGFDQQVLTQGGVLLDYQSFAGVYLQQTQQAHGLTATTPSVNEVWLHTRNDAASLASVRTALSNSAIALDNLVDRRALLASLNNDPLYVVVSGVLGIGTITALLLALIGDVLASWLSARTRLTNFAILRALGTTPGQVTSVMVWEQAVIYVTGLLLGIVFGVAFALTVVPSLTLTDVNTNINSNALYNLQTAFPAHVVLPSTLPLALLVLVGIFVLALALMARVVSRPLLAQTLRLNED